MPLSWSIETIQGHLCISPESWQQTMKLRPVFASGDVGTAYQDLSLTSFSPTD